MMYSMPLYYDLTRKMKSMDRTSLIHLQNYSKAKKSTKLKQSSITGNEDEATNTMSNGKDILSPMLPGNQNILFLMMSTLSHVINNDTIFKSHHDNNMHCDPLQCQLRTLGIRLSRGRSWTLRTRFRTRTGPKGPGPGPETADPDLNN